MDNVYSFKHFIQVFFFFFRFSFISFSVLLIVSSVLTTEANKRLICACLSRTSAVMIAGLGPAREAEGTCSPSVAWLVGSGSMGPLWGEDLDAMPLVPGSFCSGSDASASVSPPPPLMPEIDSDPISGEILSSVPVRVRLGSGWHPPVCVLLRLRAATRFFVASFKSDHFFLT